MYWASKGKGSFLNEKQIQVQQKEPIYKIVGINTSGGSNELMQRMYPIFQNHNHTRHFGANALEMALFARGLMDVFIDFRDKIRIQDIAAGCSSEEKLKARKIFKIYLNGKAEINEETTMTHQQNKKEEF